MIAIIRSVRGTVPYPTGSGSLITSRSALWSDITDERLGVYVLTHGRRSAIAWHELTALVSKSGSGPNDLTLLQDGLSNRACMVFDFGGGPVPDGPFVIADRYDFRVHLARIRVELRVPTLLQLPDFQPYKAFLARLDRLTEELTRCVAARSDMETSASRTAKLAGATVPAPGLWLLAESAADGKSLAGALHLVSRTPDGTYLCDLWGAGDLPPAQGMCLSRTVCWNEDGKAFQSSGEIGKITHIESLTSK
ncbi:MAG: hypothetical protein ACHRHE_05385 [Tepidisphaerales bacterium]